MNDYIELAETLEDIEFLENGDDLKAIDGDYQARLIAAETELIASLPF